MTESSTSPYVTYTHVPFFLVTSQVPPEQREGGRGERVVSGGPPIARFSAIDSHYLTGCREGGGAAGELALCGMNRRGRAGAGGRWVPPSPGPSLSG